MIVKCIISGLASFRLKAHPSVPSRARLHSARRKCRSEVGRPSAVGDRRGLKCQAGRFRPRFIDATRGQLCGRRRGEIEGWGNAPCITVQFLLSLNSVGVGQRSRRRLLVRRVYAETPRYNALRLRFSPLLLPLSLPPTPTHGAPPFGVGLRFPVLALCRLRFY